RAVVAERLAAARRPEAAGLAVERAAVRVRKVDRAAHRLAESLLRGHRSKRHRDVAIAGVEALDRARAGRADAEPAFGVEAQPRARLPGRLVPARRIVRAAALDAVPAPVDRDDRQLDLARVLRHQSLREAAHLLDLRLD